MDMMFLQIGRPLYENGKQYLTSCGKTFRYMRICGFAVEGLRSERRIFESFPSKELSDYWSSRPKYEEVSPKSGEFISGSSQAGASGSGGDGQQWLPVPHH